MCVVCGVDRIRPMGENVGHVGAGPQEKLALADIFLCAPVVNGGLKRPSGPSYHWCIAQPVRLR